jgi:trans-aconitate methyltransferase
VTRTPPSYFDRLYGETPDPWGFETSWYERRKYALTLAALPDPRYASAFEPGCSLGVLTEALAVRCDRVLAADHTETALHQARQRLAHLPHVTVERRTVPEDWPEGPFDLLVLSELCYYFDRTELDALLRRAQGSLARQATVVGVHWRGQTDYPLGAEETHDRIGATAGLAPVAHHEEPEFLLDVWQFRRDRP